MTITYPLPFPTVTGVRSVSLRAMNAVALERSPFTFAQQAQAYAGQMWLADVTLPTITSRAAAEEWITFITSLRGQFGTFLMGIPEASVARGAARGTDTVVVNGDDHIGGSVDITSDQIGVTGYLKAGDYIQIGSLSTTRLHKVLQDVDTDGSGNATLDIWPGLRSSPANGATVVVEGAQGRWRLAMNESEWNLDVTSAYGMSFSAVEAV